MKFNLKKMKKDFDGKSVKECVDRVQHLRAGVYLRQEEMVRILWYLENSKRFREYEGYEKLSFETFLWEICHMTYKRYRSICRAYNWHPAETRELGLELVVKAQQEVGVAGMPKVLPAMKRAAAAAKDPLVQRKKINEVIKLHAPRKTKASKPDHDTKTYWRHRYEQLLEAYRALEVENRELREQLERQKKPIAAFMKIQDEVLAHGQRHPAN